MTNQVRHLSLKRAVEGGLVAGVVLMVSLVLSAASVLAMPSSTLQLEPNQGTSSTNFTATYRYSPDPDTPCPKGDVTFTWDSQEVLGAPQPLSETPTGCQATLSTTVPAAFAEPGEHKVCGTYTAPLVAPVSACAAFTVIGASPAPTPTPTPNSASPSPAPSSVATPSLIPVPGGIIVANSASSPPEIEPDAGALASARPTSPAGDVAGALTTGTDEPPSDMGWLNYLALLVPAGAIVLLLAGVGTGYFVGRRR